MSGVWIYMDEKEIMKKANELIKGNKIDWDPHTKELVWIYNPELFKKLIEQTVDAKIRDVE